MFRLDALIDTSTVPLNIMLLRDDHFLSFVKKEVGEAAVALLQIQGINCVKSLLITANVYSIMEIKSISLEKFKTTYGYLQDDNTYIIQPGIKGNVDYLVDLLKRKVLDDAKLSKSSKHGHNQALSFGNIADDAPLSTTNSVSTISLEVSSKTTTPTPLIPSTVNQQIVYNKQTLDAWCEKNKAGCKLCESSLIGGQHYFIVIQHDSNSSSKGYIRCSCEKWLLLPIRRAKFQLSNFYRHLLDVRSGNVCRMMRNRIADIQSNSTSTINNQETISSAGGSSGNVLPTDLAPMLPSPVAIPSDSSSPVTRSMLPTTENDHAHDHDINNTEKSLSTGSRQRQKRRADTIDSSYNTRDAGRKKRR